MISLAISNEPIERHHHATNEVGDLPKEDDPNERPAKIDYGVHGRHHFLSERDLLTFRSMSDFSLGNPGIIVS